MPAPLIILAAWVGQQLASNVESDGWNRLKALVVGDPQIKDVARALERSIEATVDAVAKDGASASLRGALLNAFEEGDPFSVSSDADTVLGALRSSIDSTLRQSGLNSPVPTLSITQLEFIAPGIGLARLAGTITRFFIINITTMAVGAGSPLANLSAQLNADQIRESLQQLTDSVPSFDGKLDAILELSRRLLDRGPQSDQEEDGVRLRATAIFDTLKLAHRDYLEAFADAERLLRAGVGSTELIHFFETRRAALAAERIEVIARAELVLSGAAGNETTGLGAFAEAVSAYFESANGPTRITYFTDLLIHIRDKLQLAKQKQWSGTVHIDDYFLTTSDHGQSLLSAIAGARVALQWRFEDAAHAFAALDYLKAPPTGSAG